MWLASGHFKSCFSQLLRVQTWCFQRMCNRFLFGDSQLWSTLSYMKEVRTVQSFGQNFESIAEWAVLGQATQLSPWKAHRALRSISPAVNSLESVGGGYSHSWTMIMPIGSMYAIYMVTWIPSIYPSHVSIYTMDPMGYGTKMAPYIISVARHRVHQGEPMAHLGTQWQWHCT